MDFDFRGDLIHSNGRIFVEIALDGAAGVNGDFVGHDGTEAFDDGAANLIFGVDGIDDLAADVASDPDFVDLNFLLGVHAEFDDLRKITAMRKLEGDAHGGAVRVISPVPTSVLTDQFQSALS